MIRIARTFAATAVAALALCAAATAGGPAISAGLVRDASRSRSQSGRPISGSRQGLGCRAACIERALLRNDDQRSRAASASRLAHIRARDVFS